MHLITLINFSQSRTSFYGTHSLRSKSAIPWNTMQYELGFNFKDYDFKTLKKKEIFQQPFCSLLRVRLTVLIYL